MLKYLALITALALTLGCEPPKSKVLGKWVSGNDTIEFFSDGRLLSTEGSGSSATGSWVILDDGRMKIEVSMLGLSTVILGSLADDQLLLDVRGGPRIFTRAALLDVAAREALDSSERSEVDFVTNFRVEEVSDSECIVKVDYRYASEHGDKARIGAHLLYKGAELPYFGYKPAEIHRGLGSAAVRISFGYNSPPPKLTTDQVRLVFYRGSVFHSQAFGYKKTWLIQ